MFSQNSRQDKFQVLLPDSFFIDSIVSKYNQWVNQHPVILRTIQEMLIESIQGFDTPEFSTTLIGQTTNVDGVSKTISQYPLESTGKLLEKTFQLSFRHSDGFITYFLMLEHFFTRYQMGPGNKTKRKPFGTVIVELKLPNNNVVCRIKFHQCYLISVPSLSLSYSAQQRDITSFSCNFEYNNFETTFELPKPLIKTT